MATDGLLTQQVLEVVRNAAVPSPNLLLTQQVLEVVRGSSGVAAAVSLTGRLQLLVSGVSVANAIGLAPLTVSAVWSLSGGVSSFTYVWSFEHPTATSTTSASTRVFSAGSGVLVTSRVSAVVSDASAASSTSVFLVHVRRAWTPNPFDGRFQESNQPRRRVWPL